MNKILQILIGLLAILTSSCNNNAKGTFEVGQNTFLLNGEPFVVKAAELHYPRIPREYWEHRIQMTKALGMNTICLYIFWNIHEPEEGQFDFTGNNDVAAFCRLARKHGMHVIVRPGPLRRMGDGGITLVVIEEKRYQASGQRSLFSRTHPAVYERGEQTARRPANHKRW